MSYGDFTLCKMEKSIADQYFPWLLMFCLDAQILTFLNKSSSNSSLEIRKTYMLQTGSKELDDSRTSCVVSTETPLRSGNPEWISQRMCCEFKNDLMIWCADMEETCNAAETESVSWDSRLQEEVALIGRRGQWSPTTLTDRSHLPDLAHKLTCEPHKSILCVYCGCGGSLSVHY